MRKQHCPHSVTSTEHSVLLSEKVSPAVFKHLKIQKNSTTIKGASHADLHHSHHPPPSSPAAPRTKMIADTPAASTPQPQPSQQNETPSATNAAETIPRLTLQSLNEALQTLPQQHPQADLTPFITALTPALTENLSLLKAYLSNLLAPPPPQTAAQAQQERQRQQQHHDQLINQLRQRIHHAQHTQRITLSARIAAAKHLNSSLTALQTHTLSTAIQASTNPQIHPAKTKHNLSKATQHHDTEMRSTAAAAAQRVTPTQRLAVQMLPDSQIVFTSGAATDATVPSAAQVFDVINSQEARHQHAVHLHQLQAHLLGHG